MSESSSATAATSAVVVLQHVAPERPGLIGEVLGRKRVALRTVRTWLGEPVPTDLGGAAGLIVMGGPMGVYDVDAYPHLRAEARLIERALAMNAAVLGVCLGSQLLASVLGARVAPGPRKEIGWHRIDLAEAAASDVLFGGAPRSFTGLHWHGDVFDLPSGAVLLASSELTRHQAFRYGRDAYGILFHMELLPEMIDEWVATFAGELASENIEGSRIVEQGKQHLPALTEIGREVFGRFGARLLA